MHPDSGISAGFLILVVGQPPKEAGASPCRFANGGRTGRGPDEGAATSANGPATQHALLGGGHAGKPSKSQDSYHQQNNRLHH